MPFCPYCSHQVESTHIFCGGCGKALPADSSTHPEVVQTEQPGPVLPYRISPNRILVMTLVSAGFYLFYWFYITWQQYRNHTGNKVFPTWHTLSLTIPGYGLFRTHAHMRVLKELLIDTGVPCTISVGWVIALVLFINLLGVASLFLPGGLFNDGAISFWVAFVRALLNMVSVAIVLGILQHVQQNLNRYWASLENVTVIDLNIGAGEIILGVIGVLTWIITVASLVSPAFRANA